MLLASKTISHPQAAAGNLTSNVKKISLKTISAALLLMAAAATAQSLPSAPSVTLQQDSLRPAGSGYVYKPVATQPGPGSLSMDLASGDTLPLTLDDAISIALDRNIRMKYDRANQRAVSGYDSTVLAVLTPNLRFNASSNAQEINLAAMGFKPALFANFARSGLLPPGYKFSTIVKVQTTQAQVSLSQILFNASDLELYLGTRNEHKVVDLTTLNDRGEVVQTVAQNYLKILSDRATLANAQAQVKSAQTTFSQATDRQQAGVGTHLDALRAQVQLQQRQQDVVAADATLQKDTIQLARILGLPAGQPLELTDAIPFAAFDAMDLDAARATAYEHRKDLLILEQQIQLGLREVKAVRYQRLPTLAFNGFYGIIGLDSGPYHGVFNAEGTLRFPIFREAAQRGEADVVGAQLTSYRQQEASLRSTIDAQIRSAMLDVDAARELAKVAQSNVDLSQQELGDARERFKAGVDDNLPVVDAEATVASAESQLVNTLYQYNVAKLQLARATGVVETRYRTYIGK